MRLIEFETKEKLRGGFYTPKPIADFILKWAFNGSIDYDILEPSCGDGVFLKSIKENNYKFNTVTAIEFDPIEAEKAKKIKLTNSNVINTDFHEFCNSTKEKFDIIVGNPPYIRYQYFDKEQQDEAEKIFKRVNLKYSKLTNAWVSFVIGSSFLLKEEKGKIAFVLPAELLQVTYAQQLRDYLADYFNKITIISFKKLVFPDIQQEVILLLCEKNKTNDKFVEHVDLEDISSLDSVDINCIKAPQKHVNLKSNKWTYFFLEQKEIDFLESIKSDNSIKKIGDFANVEVGITTGSNDFFSVSSLVVDEYNLHEYAKPLVGRSVQVNSLIFNQEDWLNNIRNGAKAHLLVFPTLKELSNNKLALEYLEFGKSQNIHKGYKCGIRNEWQTVPSLFVSDALFIRRNHIYPKLILNEANAYTTDTMHRVRFKEKINRKAVVASFYNSLSLAFSEISGRSYGGGVLELMPNEAENIALPYHEENQTLLKSIDELMRKNKKILDILKITNKFILQDKYGFSESDVNLATTIWQKLSTRRLYRKR